MKDNGGATTFDFDRAEGDLTVAGTVEAGAFEGDGSGLTNVGCGYDITREEFEDLKARIAALE